MIKFEFIDIIIVRVIRAHKRTYLFMIESVSIQKFNLKRIKICVLCNLALQPAPTWVIRPAPFSNFENMTLYILRSSI